MLRSVTGQDPAVCTPRVLSLAVCYLLSASGCPSAQSCGLSVIVVLQPPLGQVVGYCQVDLDVGSDAYNRVSRFLLPLFACIQFSRLIPVALCGVAPQWSQNAYSTA